MCLFVEQPAKNQLEKITFVELEPRKKSEDLPIKPNQRIVQTSPGEKIDKPRPDAFLGWQNQVVEQETVSKRKTITAGALNHRTYKSNTSGSSYSNKERNDKKDLSKFGVSILPSASQKSQPDEPEWATPGMRPEDFAKGIKESDRTALNTREFLFYSYFQRIRGRLDQAWIPLLREKLIAYYRSGRHLSSDMDHATKVVVTLNERGEIIRVKLTSESGTRDLDDAAVAAFNKAGPFPNPPKGMIDTNREVKIPWDFILKT